MSIKYKISSILILTVLWEIGQCLIQDIGDSNPNSIKNYSLLMPNVSPKVVSVPHLQFICFYIFKKPTSVLQCHLNCF